MSIKNFYIIMCSVALTASCSMLDSGGKLEDAIAMAGDNRGELETVLEHYEGDTLKLEAAKYLICNMPGHYSYADTTIITKYSQAIDSILIAMKDSANASIRRAVDEYAQRLDMGNQKKVMDIKVISSTFLIENIDEAFRCWQEGKWAQHLTFDEFCEYLLPYKVEELQPFDNWRKHLRTFCADEIRDMDRCDPFRNSTLEATRKILRRYREQLQTQVEDGIQFTIMKWDTRLRFPFGPCDYYAPIALALLRSHGIPVASMFTPHWANQRMGHSWSSLLAENGQSLPFDALISLPGDEFRHSDIITKAYNCTYAMNEELVSLNTEEGNTPTVFKNIFLKDVTNDYAMATDIRIKAPEVPSDKKYAFLTVFGDYDWTPVDFGKVKGGHVLFKNVGKNVLYLPVFYSEGNKVNYIGNPFILSTTGKIKEIKADKKKRERLVLRKKYPTLQYAASKLRNLDKCVFQASNDADFKEYQTIHTIDLCYGIGYDVKIADSIPAYRYWRFLSTNPIAHANIAELYFFDDSGKKIDGTVIGTKETWDNDMTRSRENISDGDILTFFDAPDGDSTWVGLDFGKPVDVSHFYYYCRSDGNAIQPYDTYELLYWDCDRWQSCGKKLATSPALVYDNVPSGGVYLLRNLSRGHEERIFTYEKGKQIWW